jgi:glutathione synthase
MAQRYLPEIVDGDKRILLVDGEPVPYALARIPQGARFARQPGRRRHAAKAGR